MAATGPSAGSGAPVGESSAGASATGEDGGEAPTAVLLRGSPRILRVAPGTVRPNVIGPEPYHRACFGSGR